MPRKPIILFDVMETLVNEPFFEMVPQFFGIELDDLLRLKHPSSWIEFELGHISEEQYAVEFFRDGRPVDRQGLRDCLTASYRWLEGMQALLSDLHRQGYDMHALSNYSIWFELIEAKLRLSRYLEWTFVSCHTGVRKPDAEAFLGAARTLQVAPRNCLFVDDRLVNVDAARAVGMDAILKGEVDQLRSELSQRGILSSSPEQDQ